MHVDFALPDLPESLPALRAEVREFLAEQRSAGVFAPKSDSWTDVNRPFSEACGGRGYIGMTWPRDYGGGGRSALEQFVVVEEMLAAGAPVGGHWLADRQSGPQILKFGTDAAKQRILPQIVAGRACFAIGMSEPDTGSDLASVRTRAERVDGGWRIHGRKVWTTNAHNAQYMTVLCRSDPAAQRHLGLCQLIVSMPSEAVELRPIHNIAGSHEFNEVVFDGCFVPEDMMLGKPGDGWTIVVDELALERSGPDRYMSAFPLLANLVDALKEVDPSAETAREVGRLLAQMTTLRYMSRAVAGSIGRGNKPDIQAALVKELGAALEQATPEAVRRILLTQPMAMPAELRRHLATTTLVAPSFSLRGGTREILRGIISKSLSG